MKKVIITKFVDRFWDVAEIKFIETGEVFRVNFSYELTPDWIFIYEAIGGSGTGYRRGSIINKLYVGDCTVLTYQQTTLYDGTNEKRLLS